MALQLTAETLEDWDQYREYTKERLKLAPDGEIPIWITKKKVEFSNSYKGHAFLIGIKSKITMQALRKDGVLCKEGLCTKNGKHLDQIADLAPVLVKSSAKTAERLKLGCKIKSAGGDEGEEADSQQDTGPLDALIKKLVPMAKSAIASLPGDHSGIRDLLENIVKLRKLGDIDQATTRAKELAAVIKSAPTGGQAGASNGQPDFGPWEKARKVALTQLAKLEKALKSTGDEEVNEAVGELKKIGQQFAKSLKTREEAAAMVNYIEKDAVIRDLDGQVMLGVNLDLSRPLIASLEPAIA